MSNQPTPVAARRGRLRPGPTPAVRRPLTGAAEFAAFGAVGLRIDEGPCRQAESATDATGAVQPESRAAPFPAGTTGRRSTVVTVT